MFWERHNVKAPNTRPPWSEMIISERGVETEYIPEGLGTVVHISIPRARVHGTWSNSYYLALALIPGVNPMNGGERGASVIIACAIEGMKFTSRKSPLAYGGLTNQLCCTFCNPSRVSLISWVTRDVIIFFKSH